jgi:hypothetical protein
MRSAVVLPMYGGMPTHRDLPDGFDDAAARRRADVDAADHRARESRRELARAELQSAAELQALDEERRTTSVPPPGWSEHP